MNQTLKLFPLLIFGLALSTLLVKPSFAQSRKIQNSVQNHKSLPAGKASLTSHSNKSVAQISYREEIEPFLKANCGSCHSSDKHNSDFVIETPSALFRGGKKFQKNAIVPGKSGESVLVQYLTGKAQPRMPLNSPAIDAETIQKIKTWIDQGAKADAPKLGWPYLPPISRATPKVKMTGWVKNPIDAFILAKLEPLNLKPSPPATKTALIRRVYADLIGVPPTPEETNAFLKDSSPEAYPKLVNRLLEDTRYGERWARHWLDLVRYAETHGFENDGLRPRAWRFRDYVIKSFNSDKPYDRFIREQIAGDELYPEDPDAIVATGYARLGSWDELSTDHPQRWQDYLNDVTDTTGSVVLGLTVGCARCHNHKYDRISQNDYYRLQSFYTNTKWSETRLPPMSDQKSRELLARQKELRANFKTLEDQLRATALVEKKRRAGAEKEVTLTNEDFDQFIEASPDKRKYEMLRDSLRQAESEAAPVEPIAETISDKGKTASPSYLLLRGNLSTPGAEVAPGFIASLDGGDEKPALVTLSEKTNSTGRRTALANWLASPENPMTARVMTNRIWQHHFGKGLQGTPSDFGLNGEKTLHPELLDWLTSQFVRDGWSMKKMHRLMLLSNTYQQSTRISPLAAKVDPNNRLLWRMNRIRLEGEALRDSILAVSGRLNLQMGGPSIFPKVSDEVLSTGSTHKWGRSPLDQQLRRTIYVFQRRSLVLPIVEAFDGADMANTCPRRSATTIAPQALALFNGEFSRTEAKFFAERVVKEAGENPIAEIDRAYELALCRTPSASQKAMAIEFMNRQKSLRPEVKNPLELQKAALTELCHVLMNTNEFIYLD